MSAPPVVPPRPAKTQAKEEAPSIPPRPIARTYRSMSPNPDRFARSPLNDNLKAKNGKTLRFRETEAPERPRSVVDMPSVGEEGIEYSAIPDETPPPEGETHTVGDDVKLAAPKPKLPSQTAKALVATVTRTDSDRAASFGIGKPSSEKSLKKKASTTSQLSNTDIGDEKEGIPEIGQRIPLLSHAGDVQAPSPAPGSSEGLQARHHSRRTSARGFADLPADSYGLHGHGKTPKDKLDKAYYEKHPELLQREKVFQRHQHDRDDFARTSEDLNNIVQSTASKRVESHGAMPTEDVGYDAHVEYATRQSRPASTDPPKEENEAEKKEETIHVEGLGDKERIDNYSAPILADDEVARDPRPYEQSPAVFPPAERSGSAFEMEHPTSRPTSRPTSIHNIPTVEVEQDPLEDVQEYEPLFPEDDKESKALEKKEAPKQRFPSKDVWEDAPNSVHVTAEVSEPQPPEDADSPLSFKGMQNMDPKKVEEVMATAKAENKPRSWVEKQLKMSDGTSELPPKRFPSRDVWEDTPDSHQLQTTVSGPQEAEEEQSPVETTKPDIPARPARKATGDSTTEVEKPAVPDRPKTKPAVPDKPKPAVAGRVGGKIAALQAGFMADLNKRLQTGPQAPKKEEPVAEDLTEEKEKAPLADARKSRARGPQRRAPAVSKSPGPAAIDESPLSFSTPRTIWTVEPEEGGISISDKSDDTEEVDGEPKTLATNMAGEPVVEAKVEAA